MDKTDKARLASAAKNKKWKICIKYIVMLSTCVIVIANIFAYGIMPKWFGNSEIKVYGNVAAKYKHITKIFKNNFVEGLDREGAHFVVYEKGRVVVDLWGGSADYRSSKRWTRHTQTIIFSITKSISALCVAKLVDSGHLNWSDPVSKYWPEFAQKGKEKTTIDHVLTHQSALPFIDEQIFLSDVINRTSLQEKLARSAPAWEPGTATGYHAITQGWLIDAIIERADPQHRSLRNFFAEDFADHIAHFSLPSMWEIARDIIFDPRLLLTFFLIEMQPHDSPIQRMFRNIDWLRMDSESDFFNDVRLRRLPIGSLMGVAEARDLARLFALMLEGRIFQNPKTLDALIKPVINDWHLERVVLYPLMKGRGFFFDYHPYEKNKFVFGHPGYGCQTLHLDAENEIVVVYLSNLIKPSTSVLCRPYQRLISTVYNTLYT